MLQPLPQNVVLVSSASCLTFARFAPNRGFRVKIIIWCFLDLNVASVLFSHDPKKAVLLASKAADSLCHGDLVERLIRWELFWCYSNTLRLALLSYQYIILHRFVNPLFLEFQVSSLTFKWVQWGSIRRKHNGRWQYLSGMKNVSF